MSTWCSIIILIVDSSVGAVTAEVFSRNGDSAVSWVDVARIIR